MFSRQIDLQIFSLKNENTVVFYFEKGEIILVRYAFINNTELYVKKHPDTTVHTGTDTLPVPVYRRTLQDTKTGTVPVPYKTSCTHIGTERIRYC